MPSAQKRSSLIAVAIFAPLFVLTKGETEGQYVIEGRAPLLVTSPELGIGLDPSKLVEYVGHIDDVFVLYDPSTNELLILKDGGAKGLRLRKNPRAANFYRDDF
jgi:hypothetical protein